jgi:hypothetical protein
VILFADSLFGPLDGNVVVAGVSFNPVLVVVGALAEHFFVNHWHAEYLVEEVGDLLGPRQTAQVAMDDDAVEAMVYKNQQAGIQLCEKFHRSSVLRSCVDNSIIGQTAGGIKISNIFG